MDKLLDRINSPENLKQLSEEITKEVENAKSLVCTEENVKTIKQIRADLNHISPRLISLILN